MAELVTYVTLMDDRPRVATAHFDLIPAFHGEGVTWIRGHHAPDSEPARALLAAHAIAQT